MFCRSIVGYVGYVLVVCWLCWLCVGYVVAKTMFNVYERKVPRRRKEIKGWKIKQNESGIPRNLVYMTTYVHLLLADV